MKVIPQGAAELTNAERLYNRRLRATRQLVERVIGVLKMRFRCIIGERVLKYHQDKASLIVYACCTLHNYLIFNRFDIMHEIDANVLQEIIQNQRLYNVDNRNENNRRGTQRRANVINFFHRQAQA